MTIARAAAIVPWAGLAGYALFSPVSIAASQLFFGIAVGGTVLYFLLNDDSRRTGLPPRPLIGLILAYTAWRFLSILINHSSPIIIKEEWLFLMAIIGAILFQNVKNLTRVLDFFAVGVLVMSGYGVWQHFIGIDLYHQVLLDKMVYGYRAIGTFSTYLTYSGFFAVSAIFLVPIGLTVTSRGRKYLYLISSQVSLVSLLFNYSRSTIVALVIGIVALVLLIEVRYRKWVSLILLLTLAVGIVISPDFLNRFRGLTQTEFTATTANSRMAIWRTSLSMIQENPVFGVGPGNFAREYLEHRANRSGKVLSHAHNDIMSAAAESGIPFAIIFLFLWGLMLGYFFRGYRRCPVGFQKGLVLGALLASIVFFVMAQFEAFFSDEEVRLLLMFIWGVGLAVMGNLRASERLSEIA